MSGFELLATLVFFLIGYWIVDHFWPKAKISGTEPGRVTVRVARRFAQPPERVFDAWLDPKTAGQWPFALPAGKDLEIDRPQRLVFTLALPELSAEASRVTVDIAAKDGGCELSLAHEGVSPEHASRIEQGWRGILDALEATPGKAPGLFPKA